MVDEEEAGEVDVDEPGGEGFLGSSLFSGMNWMVRRVAMYRMKIARTCQEKKVACQVGEGGDKEV